MDQDKVFIEEITPLEKRILKAIAKGHTNKEIAMDLGLKESTVRTYNYELFKKLHVQNRTQAVIVAKEYTVI